jgi:hypothetical protein
MRGVVIMVVSKLDDGPVWAIIRTPDRWLTLASGPTLILVVGYLHFSCQIHESGAVFVQQGLLLQTKRHSCGLRHQLGTKY